MTPALLRLVAPLCLAMLAPPILAQPAIGERSPELGIEELLNAPEGAEATLDALSGKFVVLEFWATWCGPCVAAIPHLNELHETFGDRMAFISVTDEDRATFEAFQEDEPVIANWIGIDADRSLFEAYKVRGIPTTIILNDEGIVVARTHPSRLNTERMEAYLAGERDEPSAVPTPPDGADTENLLASLLSRGVRPGVDPYHPSEAPPDTVLIIRDALLTREGTTTTWSGVGGTMLNAGPDAMLRRLYALPEARLDLTALGAAESRHDLVFAGIALDTVRAELLRTLRLEEHRERRTMTAYRLVAGPDGLRATTTGPDLGYSTMFNGRSFRITGSSVEAGTLAGLLENRLGLPVEVGIDAGTRFEIDLELPGSARADDIEPGLSEALGLRLERFESEREVVVIRPADRSPDRAAAPD